MQKRSFFPILNRINGQKSKVGYLYQTRRTLRRTYGHLKERLTSIGVFLNYDIRNSQLAPYDLFKRFILFFKINSYTLLQIPRLNAIYFFTNAIDSFRIEGDIVECGVWNGGSAAIMAYVSNNSIYKRKIWLFDSFLGLPPPTAKDTAKAFKRYFPGMCSGSRRRVEEILSALKIFPVRTYIVEGWFADTFPKARVERIAILHIDADFYESVKLSLEKFYPAVQRGGYIVLDDYGTWEGCKAAADEFLTQQTQPINLMRIDKNAYYFRKP